MMRLRMPAYDHAGTLDLCCSGIVGNSSMLERVRNSSGDLEQHADEYEARGCCSEIYKIACLQNIPVGCDLVGELTHSDLLTLYNYYLRDKNKPARRVYDGLMSAANGLCPYCGGIGTPRNIDHYLPKAFFPQFSTLPVNLVPSCRDCNMDGKGEEFAKNANEQIIHPYIDQNHFFDEQWIFARFFDSPDGLAEFEFYVETPASWNDDDKGIAETHFNRFEIAKQFSTESGRHYVELYAQLKEWNRTVALPTSDFRDMALQSVINVAKFKNQWKRVMYQALLNSSWPD